MTYPKWPSEFELHRKNRQVLSERLHWPDGAAQACADLEDRHPGWYISWRRENTVSGFERPAGFWAVNDTVPQHAVEAFRADLRELEDVMTDEPQPHEYGTTSHMRWCAWCLAHRGPRPVKL